MFKKIAAILFLLFFSGLGFAMEELSEVAESPSLKKISINPSFLDLEHTEYEMHFFWTTGIQFEDCTAKIQSTQIPIGGSSIFEKFQTYITGILDDPCVPLIRFITDRLTLHTNSWLTLLHEKHPKRFLIFDIAEVVAQIELQFPEFQGTIATLFANAEKGNPAMASDAYRLIGMKSYNQLLTHSSPALKSLHIIYSDIDTFTHGLEKDPNAFWKVIFQTPPSQKILHSKNNNDILSIEIKDLKEDDSWYTELCRKVLETWSQEKYINYLSFCPQRYKAVINFGEDQESRGKITELITNQSFSTGDIPHYTGPYFLQKFESNCCALLEGSPLCTMSWAPLSFLMGNGLNLPAATIEGSSSKLSHLFFNYYQILECGLVAKKRGLDHPSSLLFLAYIQEVNPFFSSVYKESLKDYVTITQSSSPQETQNEILHTYFEALTKHPLELLFPGYKKPLSTYDSTTYLKLQHFLQINFNIHFELTELGLRTFYEEITATTPQ